MVRETSLLDHDKALLSARVVCSAQRLQIRVRSLRWLHCVAKTVVTIGSIMVPSLLALRDNPDRTDAVYWALWGVGLLTSFCNSAAMLFSIDRKYFVLKAQLRRLEREAWLYLSKAGPYRQTAPNQDCHGAHLVCFVEKCEFILEVAARAEHQDGGKRRARSQEALPRSGRSSSGRRRGIARRETREYAGAAAEEAAAESSHASEGDGGGPTRDHVVCSTPVPASNWARDAVA